MASLAWEDCTSANIDACCLSRSRVEKFAQVIHPMTAQLVEEIDLEKGQIVKITEIIDKDWFRWVELFP